MKKKHKNNNIYNYFNMNLFNQNNSDEYIFSIQELFMDACHSACIKEATKLMKYHPTINFEVNYVVILHKAIKLRHVSVIKFIWDLEPKLKFCTKCYNDFELTYLDQIFYSKLQCGKKQTFTKIQYIYDNTHIDEIKEHIDEIISKYPINQKSSNDILSKVHRKICKQISKFESYFVRHVFTIYLLNNSIKCNIKYMGGGKL